MKSIRFLFTAALATGLTTCLAGAANAGSNTAVAVPNPSFQQQTAGVASCWSLVAGAGTLSVVGDAHTGNSAAQVKPKAGTGAALELTTAQTPACGVPVAAGNRYAVGAWYRSTQLVQPVVYTYTGKEWRPWFTGGAFSAASTWAKAEVTTPAVPAGVSKIAVGLRGRADNTFSVDDVTVDGATAGSVAAVAGSTLLSTSFPTTNALVTNEYAYWNATHKDAVKSTAWEMTSGSLFSNGGNGYTGKLDAGRVDANSAARTDSAIFRLNTRTYTYGDAAVKFNLNIAALGSTADTPAEDWDGVHIWLRYQTQYSLYYASVARRDGRVVIKKKCAGGPSNDGTYYELSKEITGNPIVLNQWTAVSADARNNPDGTVTISVSRGSQQIISAVDTGVGCAPITKAGSVGVRGDNARFQFNGFTVSAL